MTALFGRRVGNIRTNGFISFFLFFSLLSFGQSDKTYTPGKLLTIYGQTFDKYNCIIPSVIIEIFDGNQKICSTKSNANGAYICIFCSKKIKSNHLTIKTTKSEFLSEIINLKFYSDTLIDIFLTPDSNKEMTAEKQLLYEKSVFTKREGWQVQEDYESNKLYHHCDGRTMNYRQIFDQKQNLDEWELIQNK